MMEGEEERTDEGQEEGKGLSAHSDDNLLAPQAKINEQKLPDVLLIILTTYIASPFNAFIYCPLNLSFFFFLFLSILFFSYTFI